MLEKVFTVSENLSKEDEEKKKQLLDYTNKHMPDLEFISYFTSYSVQTFTFRTNDPLLIRTYLKPDMARIFDAIMDVNGCQIQQDGSKIVITLPKQQREVMHLGQGIKALSQIEKGDDLTCYLGEYADGTPVIMDFAEKEHMLAAGQTGSGKSTFLHTMLLTLMSRYTEKECIFYLLDPKDDLTRYAGVPSVKATESNKAKILFVLEQVIEEMVNRQEEMKSMKITDWNRKYPELSKPHVLVVFDEIDSMIAKQYKDDLSNMIRSHITMLVKQGRSAGIHLILASQRPVKANLDTSIKSEISTRIALKLDTPTDSRIMLNQSGAEKLKGDGDAYIAVSGIPRRMQVAYASRDEVDQAIELLKQAG